MITPHSNDAVEIQDRGWLDDAKLDYPQIQRSVRRQSVEVQVTRVLHTQIEDTRQNGEFLQ